MIAKPYPSHSGIGNWASSIRTRSSITRRANYVVGAVHTNIIEGFWSIVKRGIVGTFHKVRKKYLHLYVNEFEFRYNQRLNADIFGAAIKAC